QGQGHFTVFAQIVAEVLGVDVADVHVITGDTREFHWGTGTFASRGAVVAGSACHAAAVRVREKILELAARELEAAPADLVLDGGRVHVRGDPGGGIALGALALKANPLRGAVRPGTEPGLEATAYFGPDSGSTASGVHAMLVEVDPETAQVEIKRYVVVHDCGRVINPMIVEGQIHGGVAHGIGNSFYDQRVSGEVPMKPAAFDYFTPTTVPEALALLAEHGGDAKPLAGGQSLIPAMNFRLARPAVLVDLNRIAELAYVRAGGKDAGLVIGAMARQRAVERSDVVARAAPLVAEAMPSIAHPQIRNRGTVGGSVAHADPAAELPAVMLALEARFRAQSSTGERSIPVAEFFKGMLETALAPGELLVEIAVPALPARTGTAFLEMARRHGDYALVGVAAVVTLDTKERCHTARIAGFSV